MVVSLDPIGTREMQSLERNAEYSGLSISTLMENAGQALYNAVTKQMDIKQAYMIFGYLIHGYMIYESIIDVAGQKKGVGRSSFIRCMLPCVLFRVKYMLVLAIT